MLNRSIYALLFVMVLGYASYAQTECEKYTDAAFKISFCVPTGWTIHKVPGKGTAIAGEQRDGLTPNLNVRGAPYPGTLSEAADFAIETILKSKPAGASKIQLESKTGFSAGNARGVKAVFNLEVNGVAVRTIQYYFRGRGQTKIAVTATLPTDADDLETLVDDALKTFTVN